MKTIRIGRTGVEITPIAFGCASIGNLYREVAEEDAQQVLQAAWDAGIRYFDTAPHYGRGLSEQRLGRFLTGRTGAVLSTKVGRVLTPAAAPIPEAEPVTTVVGMNCLLGMKKGACARDPAVCGGAHRPGIVRPD